MITRKRAIVSLAASALALGMGTAGASAPHEDTSQSQRAPYGLRLYYNSNYGGSYADFGGPVGNFAGYTFNGPGNGQGQGVKNNAASACNNSGTTLRIYYNSWYGGSWDQLAPWSCRNLAVTYNENASWRWV